MPKIPADELTKATRSKAAAFVEDLPHIREILKRTDTDKRAVRSLSNELRRILVDGDLRDVAAPRIGRYSLLSFDNAPIFKAERKAPFAFFQSGGAAVCGAFIRAGMVEHGNRRRALDYFDSEQTISLPLDNFLSQKVLCLNGTWASRREVIKYVAHVAHGVHSGQPRDAEHILLNRIRHVAKFSVQPVPPGLGAPEGEKMLSFQFNIDALSDGDMEFTYDAKAIDPTLVELLATAHLLVISPDIVKLEASIKQELGL